MAFNLSSISRGKAERAPRILMPGVQGIGKSTWAAGAPNPLFLPIIREEGIDEINAAKTPTINSYGELIAALSALASDPHDFKTLVIDSVSALEPLVFDETCRLHGLAEGQIERVLGGYGKGYKEALKPWRDVLTALDYLRNERGMGCILIAHVAVKTFNDPTADAPYDTYEVAMQKDGAAALERWADAILFANRKVYAKTVAKTGMGSTEKKIIHATGTGDRVMFTDKRPAHPGKSRYPGMPYELE
ncbi:MAG: hypothetical protein JWO31_2083, partial [Phycisphaerales bacterium]|nr:hypothetical protein [Phycisphaerales bacterium]